MKHITTSLIAVLLAACVVMPVTAGDKPDVSDAWATLRSDVETMAQQIQTARGMEEKMQLIEKIENMFVEFRENYPNTPESQEAGFQLGIIKQQIGDFGGAIEFLSEYILKASSANDQQMAVANYYLAEAYKGAGKYDDARATYEKILKDYASANARLTQIVRTSLSGLDTEAKLAIGAEPISFNVKSIKGETLTPEKFKGKVLLLDFWATWCGPCRADMPTVKRVYEKYKDQGFEVVGVSLDRTRSALDSYLKENNITWHQYYDEVNFQNDLADKYGVQLIPATFLIDREGKIRYKSLRGDQLEVAVKQLLAEE